MRILLIVLAGLLLALPSPAVAQLGDLGQLRLSFEEATTSQILLVQPGESITFYIVIEHDFGSFEENQSDGMIAWEASVVLPPELTNVQRTILRDPINCLNDTCGNDFSLGYSTCVNGVEMPATLVRYDATVSSISAPLEISLQGHPQSSTEGVPGWLNCAGPQMLSKFASGWDTPLRLELRVADAERTWSSVKADFD